MNDTTRNTTEDNATAQSQKITLQLTDEQKKMLTDAFGSEFEGKIRSIQIEKVAGFLKAEAQKN
jgi:hypothetical protein